MLLANERPLKVLKRRIKKEKKYAAKSSEFL